MIRSNDDASTIISLHYVMLLGVAVLDLDSHPDYNNGSYPRTLQVAQVIRNIPNIDHNHNHSRQPKL